MNAPHESQILGASQKVQQTIILGHHANAALDL